MIIVLGLLAVMTILAVSFAIAMRIERLAARNYANLVRAEHLIQVGFIRAMEEANNECIGECYPPFNAIRSPGTLTCPDLLTGEVTNAIPRAALANMQTLQAGWTNIVNSDGITNGRIAYILADVSGFVDVSHIGGAPRVWSTNVNQLYLGGHPDFSDTNLFFQDRTLDHRYETLTELYALNTGISQDASNLWVYSYDPGRDYVFMDPNLITVDQVNTNPEWYKYVDWNNPPAKLGYRDAEDWLHPKFNINSITQYWAYSDPGNPDSYTSDTNFMQQYYKPLSDMLELAGMERPDDVTWNIINWLDPDRIPQAEDGMGYTHSEGGEAMPLMNEIVLRETAASSPGNREYEFAIEFWYPFAPIIAESSATNYYIVRVACFTNCPNGPVQGTPPPGGCPPELDVMHPPYCYDDWTFDAVLPEMEFTPAKEFHVVVSPPGKKISFGGADIDAVTNSVWMNARLYDVCANQYGQLVTNIVDEAMGYLASPDENWWKRRMFRFTEPRGYSRSDPRSNGQVKYWTTYGNGPAGVNKGGIDYPPVPFPGGLMTLGATNVTCIPPGQPGALSPPYNNNPWSGEGGGVPIFALNGPMRNIGELGHTWRSNLDDEQPVGMQWWRNIELMKENEGAALMDYMTVRSTNRSERGLIAINSRYGNSLHVLLNQLVIGYTNQSGVQVPNASQYNISTDPAKVQNLVNTIMANQPYHNFKSMFPGDGGDLADAFIACTPHGDADCDILEEDTYRHILDLITFRQNLFAIVVAAQALAPDGTVIAEKRAIGTIFRDSYTSKYFIRSFKWIGDN
jgi:hypothetical protein